MYIDDLDSVYVVSEEEANGMLKENMKDYNNYMDSLEVLIEKEKEKEKTGNDK